LIGVADLIEAVPVVEAALRRRGAGAIAGRLGWGLADQAVSSLTNFAVGLVVARDLGATRFGEFSLAWLTYGLMLNVSRGVATDPLMVRFSGGLPRAIWAAAVRSATGAALAVGSLTSALVVVVGWALGGELGGGFLALGLTLPAVFLQDSWRFAFFAAGEGHKSLLNDCVWAIFLVPALIFAHGAHSMPGYLLGWGAAGAVAALFGMVQSGMVPDLGAVGIWLGRHRDLCCRYVLDNSLSSAAQVWIYGMGAIAGLAAVGTVRGAQQLFGPFQVLVIGFSMITVSEGARMLRTRPQRLIRLSIVIGMVQSTAAAIWGCGLMLLPTRVGRGLLGGLWDQSSRLILPAMLVVVGTAWYTAGASGLRALAAARRSLRARIVSSTLTVSCALTGASVDGARGAIWGIAGAMVGNNVALWTHLRRGLREYLIARSESGPVAQDGRQPGREEHAGFIVSA